MIPKIIHYVWFGGKPLPEKMARCVATWREKMPDYELREWNEGNFDVNATTFTREAYEQGQWAFVSDYVRLWALARYGGWYLDTDVEVVRSFDTFEGGRMVLGTDEHGALTAVYGTEAGHPFWREALETYSGLSFVRADGTLNQKVINAYLEELLERYGYVRRNERQSLAGGIEVYPDDYFHVASILSGRMHRTENTYAIHWQTLSWCGRGVHVKRFIRVKILGRLLGGGRAARIAQGLQRLKVKLSK